MKANTGPEGEGTSLEHANAELCARLDAGKKLIQSFQFALNTVIYISYDDLRDLLDTIVSLSCSAFEAKRGCIFFTTDDTTYDLTSGFNVEGIEPVGIREGLVGAAAEKRVPLVVTDWSDAPELQSVTRPSFIEPPFVLTSIDIHDSPVGVIYLGFEPGNSLLEEIEPEYFKLFSGVAATSISSCRALIQAKKLTETVLVQRDELKTTNVALEQQAEEQREYVETIKIQQEEIQRLSTPVVSIWDRVLCLPLVGVLDSQRAQQAMEVLLQQIIDEKAKVAIVDITGVPFVDTLVANHLAQTMAAVRLIGATGLLTGISANVAQTLVRMGVDISEITMRRTLADGLKFAITLVEEDA
jgi:anti-anti-sigma regulatory factor